MTRDPGKACKFANLRCPAHRRLSGKDVRLFEGYAYPLFFAPDDVTGQVGPVRNQHKMFGDSDRAGYVQSRASGR